jgi:pimeloyl-ACP methyl ester carboxylesterase
VEYFLRLLQKSSDVCDAGQTAVSFYDVMAKKTTLNPSDFIMPLNINGLEGRMLRLPGDTDVRNKEILFIYGHHSSLERWWGLMLAFRHYGNVTMPDLPGFGGMDSFYKIGKKPTIDNLADYLAAFMMLRFKQKKVIVAGMSFGFVVVTRMLQRHPDLTKRVIMLVSIVGFAHRDDFTFSKTRHTAYLTGSRVFRHRLPAAFFRYVCLSPPILRSVYGRTHNAKHKFSNSMTKDELKYFMDFEIGLWHENDVRTYMFTTTQFLQFDNCQAQVDLPVWHVSAQADHFFDNNVIEQHMRIIFNDFHGIPAKLTTHAPSVIADEAIASAVIPVKLRHVLKSL